MYDLSKQSLDGCNRKKEKARESEGKTSSVRARMRPGRRGVYRDVPKKSPQAVPLLLLPTASGNRARGAPSPFLFLSFTSDLLLLGTTCGKTDIKRMSKIADVYLQKTMHRREKHGEFATKFEKFHAD